MKTIDKKDLKKDKSRDHVNKLLVEDPSGHHLLSKDPRKTDRSVVDDLIQIKLVRDKKKHSVSLLVSSISLCLSLVLVIGMFEWKSRENGSNIDLALTNQDFEDLVEIPQTEQLQKPPPVQAHAPKIIEVEDEEIIEEIEINLDIEMTEDTRIEQVIYDTNGNEPIPEEDADEIFTIVEEQPSPVGGIKAFYDYVAENLRYPPRAARMGIEGRVFVEFIVEKNGSLTDINVVKAIGGGCDEEAIRVISTAPKWNPGKQRGNPVRVRMILPIMFRLVN